MKNEIQSLSNDLNVITAEINAYKELAGRSIFEIGYRLNHVKHNPREYGLPVGHDKEGNEIVANGEWGDWLKSVQINQSTANKMMKVYKELGDNSDTCPNLGWRALYEIATLPEEERNKPHETSSGETKTVDEMTVKELRDLKSKLKDEEAARKKAESERNQLGQMLNEERNRPPKVETQPDPETEEKLRRYHEKFGDITDDGGTVRRVRSKEEQDEFFEAFMADLQDLRRKYSDLNSYGKNFRKWIEEEKGQPMIDELEAFTAFFNTFSRVLHEDQTIIDVQ